MCLFVASYCANASQIRNVFYFCDDLCDCGAGFRKWTPLVREKTFYRKESLCVGLTHSKYTVRTVVQFDSTELHLEHNILRVGTECNPVLLFQHESSQSRNCQVDVQRTGKFDWIYVRKRGMSLLQMIMIAPLI